MEIKKINSIHSQLAKLNALLLAADDMADHFEATQETKEEHERFLTLFYMAVDTVKELKPLMEVL